MSLQRCEGASLEEVLADVRSRWGDAATIVEANRLRKGGVAGFFARQCFELVVDDSPAEARDGDADGPPAGGADDGGRGLADRLLGLADDVSDSERARTVAGEEPRISTDQPDFAAVLDAISRQLDEGEAGYPAAAPAPGPAPAAAPAPGPAPAAVPAPAAAPAPPPAIGPPAVAPLRSEVARPTAAYLAFTPAAPPPSAQAAEALVRLGLPEELARVAPAGRPDATRWLALLLEGLPVPERLPGGRGAVVAVVGSHRAALDLAGELAAEMRLDGDAVVLASTSNRGQAVPEDRHISSVEFASEQRRSWRRRTQPTVVSVEAPCGRPADWARRVLDALEPTMVWAAVEASRKPEDVIDWAGRLGGVDALAVTGLDETVSPAAVLRCGIPVGRLEGRAASPALWVALLGPRLEAQGIVAGMVA